MSHFVCTLLHSFLADIWSRDAIMRMRAWQKQPKCSLILFVAMIVLVCTLFPIPFGGLMANQCVVPVAAARPKTGNVNFAYRFYMNIIHSFFFSPLLSVVGHLSQSLELDGRVVPIDLCKFTVWLSFFFFFFVMSVRCGCCVRWGSHDTVSMWIWRCESDVTECCSCPISRMCVVYLYLARRHDRWQSKSSIHLNRNQLLTSVCYLYDRTFVCFLIWITIVRLMLMARWRQKEHVNLLPTSVERFGSVRMNHCKESIMFGHIGSAFGELG